MAREEGLRITNELQRLRLPNQRNVKYNEMALLENKDVKANFLQDETQHVGIQQDFAIDLLNFIDSQHGQTSIDMKQFFAHPGVFDGFVSVMV